MNTPKESPLNTPTAYCQHCGRWMTMDEMIRDAQNRLFCSTICRVAREVFDEILGADD